MSVIIALAALALLMLAAYRGYSVILFAPIAALGAVLLTDPGAVGPAFTGLFMEKMVGFVKLYFPVFLLGAVFGKLIELSGFSRSIVAAAIRILAPPRDPGDRAGVRPADLRRVSLFVVAFAVYPFAAELFRQSGIPKRLIPPPSPSGHSRLPWTPCPARRRSRILFPPASSAPTPGRPGWGLSARCSLSSSVCCGWSVSAAKRRPARRLWDRPAK
jgi:hypothetical protein